MKISSRVMLVIVFCLIIFSCNDKNIVKIQRLIKENDSLKLIVSEINEKYVFDSVAVRDIPSYKNLYKLNSEVSGEIVFVGYNLNNNTSVILSDSIGFGANIILKNPDTLQMKNGGFIYKVKLKKNKTSLKGLLTIKNKFGKDYEAVYSTLIKTKD